MNQFLNHSIVRTFFPLLIFSLILSACGKAKDQDKIADAQSCLDGATSATTASQCMTKVEGISSPGADLIRCIGNFMAEGYFSPTKIQAALNNMSTSGTGGASSSIAVMGTIAFTGHGTDTAGWAANQTAASNTFTYCKNAGTKGLTLLSQLALTATTVAKIAGLSINADGSISTASLTAALASAASDPAASALIGSAIVSAYDSNCANGQSTGGNFCQQYSSTITASGGSSNTAAIGQLALECYGNPALAQCAGKGF